MPWARATLALGLAVLLMAVVGAAFWFQEWRYLRPTPRPINLAEVSPGTAVPLANLLSGAGFTAKGDARPIFLHFFNADCPCSRFNVDHLLEVYRANGQKARFAAVIQASGTAEELESIRARALRTFGGMPVIMDADGHLAEACGVYSTPQAAILSAPGVLLYRGNYNTSRYCDDVATQFARIALEAVLAGHAVPDMPPAATTAYGCELPAYTEHRPAAAPTL